MFRLQWYIHKQMLVFNLVEKHALYQNAKLY